MPMLTSILRVKLGRRPHEVLLIAGHPTPVDVERLDALLDAGNGLGRKLCDAGAIKIEADSPRPVRTVEPIPIDIDPPAIPSPSDEPPPMAEPVPSPSLAPPPVSEPPVSEATVPSAPLETLRGVPIAKAGPLIERETDLDRLDRWREADKRAGIHSLIDGRLDTLLDSPAVTVDSTESEG